MRVRFLLAIAAAIAVLGISLPHAASAAPVLTVTKLECALHPGLFDVIYIKNSGDAAQDLAGWQIRSDPEGAEQMSLAVAGAMDPGEELIVVAGQHGVTVPTENVWLWTNSEVLRDSGDPADYIKLYNASGGFVSGLDCNGQTLTAAPPPTAAPTPQPQQPTTGTGTGGQTTTAPTSTAPRAQSSGPKAVPASGGEPGPHAPGYWLPLGIATTLAGAALVTAGLRSDAVASRIKSNEGDSRTRAVRRHRDRY